MKTTTEAMVGFQGTIPYFYQILLKVEEEIIYTANDGPRKDSLIRLLKKVLETIDTIGTKREEIDLAIEFLGSDKGSNVSNEDTNVRLMNNFWNDFKDLLGENIDQIIKNDIRRYSFFVSLSIFFNDMKKIQLETEEEESKARIDKKKAERLANSQRRKVTPLEQLRITVTIDVPDTPATPAERPSNRQATRTPTLLRPAPSIVLNPHPEQSGQLRTLTRKVALVPKKTVNSNSSSLSPVEPVRRTQPTPLEPTKTAHHGERLKAMRLPTWQNLFNK